MQYIPVNGGETYIEYDPETKTSKVLVKADVQAELEQATARLTEIPSEKTDEEKIARYNANRPEMDYSVERKNLEDKIALNKSRLKAMT